MKTLIYSEVYCVLTITNFVFTETTLNSAVEKGDFLIMHLQTLINIHQSEPVIWLRQQRLTTLQQYIINHSRCFPVLFCTVIDLKLNCLCLPMDPRRVIRVSSKQDRTQLRRLRSKRHRTKRNLHQRSIPDENASNEVG